LVQREEIAAVQGSPIKDTNTSGRSDGSVQISQCYYAAEQSNRSVSLALTTSDGTAGGKARVKDSWQQMFSGKDEDADERKGDKEKRESLREQSHEKGEEKKVPPKKIEGLGGEAYWVGSPVGGALYVFIKDAILRISLGGPDQEPVRIDKSKTLLQKAIQRL
jgi:hypothetical protein